MKEKPSVLVKNILHQGLKSELAKANEKGYFFYFFGKIVRRSILSMILLLHHR